MTIIPIDSAGDPRVADYRDTPHPERLRARGLFVAEGRLVVRRLLEQSRVSVRSVLVSPAALEQLSDVLQPADALPKPGPTTEDIPVFVAPLALVSGIGGFNFHRGCLAIGERPPPASARDLVASARLVVILERVVNADNVGGIFRNAAAFGADGVLLSPGCCDPLYRKSLRTSSGAALTVPFAGLLRWPEEVADLRAAGFAVVALTPRDDALDIAEFAAGPLPRGRLALVLGTEGEGLAEATERVADARVRIPISAAIDSLNVATAAAIVLQRIREQSGVYS